MGMNLFQDKDLRDRVDALEGAQSFITLSSVSVDAALKNTAGIIPTLSQNNTPADRGNIKRAMENCAPAMDAVSLIANRLATAKWTVNDSQGNPLPANAGFGVWERTPISEKRGLAIDYLVGEAFAVIVGDNGTSHLRHIPTENMELKTGGGRTYWKRNNAEDKSLPTEFALDEVMHWVQDAKGKTALRSLYYEMLIYHEIALTDYARYRNRDNPQVLYIAKNIVNKADEEDFINNLKSNHQGAENAGKSGVVTGDVDVKIIGEAGLESHYVTDLPAIQEMIISTIGVPRAVLKQDASNRATAETAEGQFMSDTLTPPAEDLKGTLNVFLLYPAGDTEYSFQYKFKEYVDPDRMERAYLHGAITLNRYLESLGEPTIGDEGEVRVGQTPDRNTE